MLKIHTRGSKPPVTVDLPGGATITLRPWASAAMVAGQKAFTDILMEGGSRADANVAFTAGAVAWAAVSWTGIFDEDDAAEAPVLLELTPERVIDLISQNGAAYMAVDQDYVLLGLDRDKEKNASALAPAGDMAARAETPTH